LALPQRRGGRRASTATRGPTPGRPIKTSASGRAARKAWTLASTLVSGQQRNPTFGYTVSVELAKLSRKGQLSIPKRLLKALGVEGEAYFLVELAPEGGLLLRPAGVYPLEVYAEERLQELLAEDTLTEEERARLAALAR